MARKPMRKAKDDPSFVIFTFRVHRQHSDHIFRLRRHLLAIPLEVEETTQPGSEWVEYEAMIPEEMEELLWATRQQIALMQQEVGFPLSTRSPRAWGKTYELACGEVMAGNVKPIGDRDPKLRVIARLLNSLTEEEYHELRRILDHDDDRDIRCGIDAGADEDVGWHTRADIQGAAGTCPDGDGRGAA